MPIYEFKRPWPVYSVAFKRDAIEVGQPYREHTEDCVLAALGSSLPGLQNKVDIGDTAHQSTASSQPHQSTARQLPTCVCAVAVPTSSQHEAADIISCDPIHTFDHAYPVSKILWSPNGQNKLASAGHDLRLWNFNPGHNRPIVESGWQGKRTATGEMKAPIAAIVRHSIR